MTDHSKKDGPRMVPGDSPVGTTHDPNSNTTGTSVEPEERHPPKRRDDDAALRGEDPNAPSEADERPVHERAAASAEAGQRDAKVAHERIETPDRADPAGLTGAAPLRTTDFDRRAVKDSKD